MRTIKRYPFYRILDVIDDVAYPDRWFLGQLSDSQGRPIDNREFTCGKQVEMDKSLTISVREHGRPLDFTLADFSLPVVKSEIAQRLSNIAPTAVQLVAVELNCVNDPFTIVNVLNVVDCLDEEASVEKWWTESARRPDKLGWPRSVREIVLLAEAAAGHEIFRIARWTGPIIVSDKTRMSLELAGCTGAKFIPVPAG